MIQRYRLTSYWRTMVPDDEGKYVYYKDIQHETSNNHEKDLIAKVTEMCDESLDPDTHDKWLGVIAGLKLVRRALR